MALRHKYTQHSAMDGWIATPMLDFFFYNSVVFEVPLILFINIIKIVNIL